MAHTFNYAVLMAVPDRSRGERVNVGIIVFLENRVDVRFASVAKIGAIAGGNWHAYTEDLQKRLTREFKSGTEAERLIAVEPRIDTVIEASALAPLVIQSAAEYEDTLNEILGALVVRPRAAEVRPRSTRINTEIARSFRNEKILADRDEPIETHRVVRDFPVENELRADFALKNGVMHVAATLDLRRSSVDIRDATLKAVVLDRAKEQFGRDTRCISVYALGEAEAVSDHFKTHIDLLNEYSDPELVFNWLDESSRHRFQSTIVRAYGLERLGRLM